MKLEGLSHISILSEDLPEKYILTKEEEDLRISNEIQQRIEQLTWKLNRMGLSGKEIKAKILSIDWSKEFNREEILKQANSSKHQNIWHQEQREREIEEEKTARQKLIERCDAKYFFKLMKWTSENIFGKRLLVTNDNKKFITALCYFLSRDERFEKELGHSLKKGLLIRGISGVGKTFLVRCIEENSLSPINVLSMIDIQEEIRTKGEYAINMAGKKIIYLDDVGTEEATVNHFGTKINFFKNFIELVYLKNQNKTFSQLMISTNNSFAEIEDKYGFRVRSRMNEMFNVIDVTGSDMRTKQK